MQKIEQKITAIIGALADIKCDFTEAFQQTSSTDHQCFLTGGAFDLKFQYVLDGTGRQLFEVKGRMRLLWTAGSCSGHRLGLPISPLIIVNTLYFLHETMSRLQQEFFILGDFRAAITLLNYNGENKQRFIDLANRLHATAVEIKVIFQQMLFLIAEDPSGLFIKNELCRLVPNKEFGTYEIEAFILDAVRTMKKSGYSKFEKIPSNAPDQKLLWMHRDVVWDAITNLTKILDDLIYIRRFSSESSDPRFDNFYVNAITFSIEGMHVLALLNASRGIPNPELMEKISNIDKGFGRLRFSGQELTFSEGQSCFVERVLFCGEILTGYLKLQKVFNDETWTAFISEAK